MKPRWVIFGSGAVAEAILREGAGWNQSFVLAGRNARSLRALSSEYGLPFTLAPLGSSEIDDLLCGSIGVINTAGPFNTTAAPLMRSAIRARTHYIDLSNEWRSHRCAFSMDVAARRNRVAIVPGGGFGTYACEVLANHVLQRVPDAVELAVVLSGRMGRHTPARRASISAVVAERALQRVQATLTPVSDFRGVRHIRIPGINARSIVPISNGNLFALLMTIDLPSISSFGTTKMPTSLARIALPVLRRIARLNRSTVFDSRRSNEPQDPPVLISSASSLAAKATSVLTVADGSKFSAATTLQVAQRLSSGAFWGTHTAAEILGGGFEAVFPGVSILDL